MSMHVRLALAVLLLFALLPAASAQTKSPAKRKPAAESAESKKPEPAPDLAADPNAKLLLENDKTAVYLLELPPNGESAMHRHPHDYLLLALTPLNARAVWGKNDSRPQRLDAGQMDIIKTPVIHKVVNQSSQPYRALIIELKNGFHPEYIVCGLGKRTCPADTGDLQDPTQQYSVSELFETDAVAVIRFSIGPGATVTKRTEKYPALRVALSDLSLADAAGDQTASIRQAPGEVQWAPAQGEHTLTNPGSSPADFYWIEFK